MRGSSEPTDNESLEAKYKRRHQTVLMRLADALAIHIRDCMEGHPRIDRISARSKGVDRFLKKAGTTLVDGRLKYTEPLTQIQDQIGARIVLFYKSDVE